MLISKQTIQSLSSLLGKFSLKSLTTSKIKRTHPLLLLASRKLAHHCIISRLSSKCSALCIYAARTEFRSLVAHLSLYGIFRPQT